MNEITHVIIACHKGDVHLTRICVASVRFWYPEIPIFLLKDDLHRPFSTEEIERKWNVKLWDRKGRKASGFINKLAMFFSTDNGRAMYLDSDIVMLGRVIEKLEERDEDLLISAETLPDPSSNYVHTHFYDWQKLQRFDPQFMYPQYCFNTGQYVWRLGVINESDFAGVVELEGAQIGKLHDAFRCWEQGAVNYVVQKKQQEGRVRVGNVDFARWIDDPRVGDFEVGRIADRTGYPFLLHWASPGSKHFIGRLKRADILSFFERYYYSRVCHGRLKCLARTVCRIPSAASRFSQEVRNRIAIRQRLRKWLRVR